MTHNLRELLNPTSGARYSTPSKERDDLLDSIRSPCLIRAYTHFASNGNSETYRHPSYFRSKSGNPLDSTIPARGPRGLPAISTPPEPGFSFTSSPDASSAPPSPATPPEDLSPATASLVLATCVKQSPISNSVLQQPTPESLSLPEDSTQPDSASIPSSTITSQHDDYFDTQNTRLSPTTPALAPPHDCEADANAQQSQSPAVTPTFFCNPCKKTFDTARQLRKHENQTHNLRYLCNALGCNARFGLKGSLTRHQMAQHPGLFRPASLSCPLCDAVVHGRRDNFTRHLRTQHGMDKNEAQKTVPLAR